MGLMKCQNCGRTISEEMVDCPVCGINIKRRAFYNGHSARNPIPVRCPWCGEMVPGGERSCPGCGSPIQISYGPGAARE